MTIAVGSLSPSLEFAWEEYVWNSPDATIFHSLGWKRVVERTFGFEASYLVARRGGRVAGLLPLFIAPRFPRGVALVSLPYAVYGGIVADGEGETKALLDAAENLLERRRADYLELRQIRAVAPGLPRKDLYATFRRRIFPTEEENMAIIPRKERAEIRKGLKSGLESKIGGKEYLDGFYDVFSASVRNLGTPVFPKALFVNLLEEFGEQCRILIVCRGGDIVSGVLTLFFRNQVMPYYGGARKEFFHLSVNDRMYWDLMCHGMRNGYEIFDFGRSKKGTGPYRFKEHWGFQPEPLEYQYCLRNGRKMPNISPANPKFQPAIEIWKRLPLSITKTIGPPITKYLY